MAPQAFEFSCPTPGCGRRYRATADLVGKTIIGKSCKQKAKVPGPHDRAEDLRPSRAEGRDGWGPPSPSGVKRAEALGGLEKIECPHCGAGCRIRPQWRGQTLECPSCKARFVLAAKQPPAAALDYAADLDVSFVTEDPGESEPKPEG